MGRWCSGNCRRGLSVLVSTIKNMQHTRRALDVSASTASAALSVLSLTGVLVALCHGAGIMDYTTGKIADYDSSRRSGPVITKSRGDDAAVVRHRLVHHLLVVDYTVGLVPSVDEEREGL